MCKSRHPRCRVIGVAVLALLIGSAACLDTAVAQTPEHVKGSLDMESLIEQASGEHLIDPGHVKNEPDYNLPPLAFDPTMFVFTLVLFGGFVLIMKSAVWQPLLNSLDAREGRIAQAELDAKATSLEAQKLTEKAEARMIEVQHQVSAILAKARAEAEAQKAEITAKAEAEAQRIKQDALAAIAHAKAEAVEQLEQAANEQVALATEHVAGVRF